MATQDKVLLLQRIEDVLKPRMFANFLEEAMTEFQITLDEFDVVHVTCNGGTEIEECLETFLNAKRVEGRSDGTITRYAYIVTRFMLWANVKTRDVNTEHVRAYLDYLYERGLKESTVEGIRQCLNAYFSWLEHEKLIFANPVFNIAAIRCEEEVRPAFTVTEIEKMKRCCKTKRDLAIICFLLSTGCRVSEMTGLNRDDIDLTKGECVVHGKGKYERYVYFDELAKLAIREYLASRNDMIDALFVSKQACRLTNSAVRVMLKQLEDLSGVEHIHPHKFRRTMITRLLERGMPIHEVSILAGHNKIDTTMGYYTASNNKIKNSYIRFTA